MGRLAELDGKKLAFLLWFWSNTAKRTKVFSTAGGVAAEALTPLALMKTGITPASAATAMAHIPPLAAEPFGVKVGLGRASLSRRFIQTDFPRHWAKRHWMALEAGP